jgi:hypothetical protein
MSPEELSAAAGVILSLSFSYIPGLHERYACLSPTQKRLVMLGLLAAAALGAVGLSCYGGSLGAPQPIECSQAGVWGVLKALLAAVIANQSAFAVSPKRNCRDGKTAPAAAG